MQAALPYALFVVMLAQGAALAPGSAAVPARAVGLFAGLRLIVLPLIALAAARIFDAPPGAAVGLVLALLTPVAAGALPLGGIAGANVPVLAALAWMTSAGFVIVSPGFAALGGGVVRVIGAALVWVVLPLAAGYLLRARLAPFARLLALLSSALTGLVIVAALFSGGAGQGAAMAAGFVAVAAGGLSLWGGTSLGVPQAEAMSVALANLIALPVVVIGLAAAMLPAPAFAAPAFAAAASGVAGYLVALLLIVMRLRATRR